MEDIKLGQRITAWKMGRRGPNTARIKGRFEGWTEPGKRGRFGIIALESGKTFKVKPATIEIVEVAAE